MPAPEILENTGRIVVVYQGWSDISNKVCAFIAFLEEALAEIVEGN